MCTLAVYLGVSATYPLIIAANRDEFFGRPALPPAPLPQHPLVVAGRDVQAGGTWLGARIDGVGRVAGLLNRRPVADRPGSGPGELSRGLLCMEALVAPSIDTVLANLDDRQASRYGGFNLFVAEPGRAVVVDNGAGVRTTELGEGLSVLTNLDVNDPRCPRLAGATILFAGLQARVAAGEEPESLVTAFAAVLGDHGGSTRADARLSWADQHDDGDTQLSRAAAHAGDDGPLSRLCVHTPSYGTRSSSLIFVARDGKVRYFHADGPPCATRFDEVGWAR